MINELVEVCGMKAIIICNSDMLGEKFIYEVLRSKLNCIEYKKIVTVEVTQTVMDTVLQSIHLENKEQQKRLQIILNIMQGSHWKELLLIQNFGT